MTERCFNCKYCKLEGDTYFSKWVCKKYGKLPDSCYCTDWKKRGIIQKIFG